MNKYVGKVCQAKMKKVVGRVKVIIFLIPAAVSLSVSLCKTLTAVQHTHDRPLPAAVFYLPPRPPAPPSCLPLLYLTYFSHIFPLARFLTLILPLAPLSNVTLLLTPLFHLSHQLEARISSWART